MDNLINLDSLSEEEKNLILSVIKRDEDLKREQYSKVLLLKTEIHNLRKQSILRGGDNSNKICIRCRKQFGFFFDTGDICSHCKYKICSFCRETLVSGGWLCCLCFKQMQLKWMTGEWIYGTTKKCPKFLPSGGDIIKASIKRSASKGNITGSDDNGDGGASISKASSAISSRDDLDRITSPQDSDKKRLSHLFNSFKSVKAEIPDSEVNVQHISCRRRVDSDTESSSSEDSSQMEVTKAASTHSSSALSERGISKQVSSESESVINSSRIPNKNVVVVESKIASVLENGSTTADNSGCEYSTSSKLSEHESLLCNRTMLSSQENGSSLKKSEKEEQFLHSNKTSPTPITVSPPKTESKVQPECKPISVQRSSSGRSDTSSISLSSTRTASPGTKMRLLDLASRRALERDVSDFDETLSQSSQDGSEVLGKHTGDFVVEGNSKVRSLHHSKQIEPSFQGKRTSNAFHEHEHGDSEDDQRCSVGKGIKDWEEKLSRKPISHHDSYSVSQSQSISGSEVIPTPPGHVASITPGHVASITPGHATSTTPRHSASVNQQHVPSCGRRADDSYGICNEVVDSFVSDVCHQISALQHLSDTVNSLSDTDPIPEHVPHTLTTVTKPVVCTSNPSAALTKESKNTDRESHFRNLYSTNQHDEFVHCFTPSSRPVIVDGEGDPFSANVVRIPDVIQQFFDGDDDLSDCLSVITENTEPNSDDLDCTLSDTSSTGTVNNDDLDKEFDRIYSNNLMYGQYLDPNSPASSLSGTDHTSDGDNIVKKSHSFKKGKKSPKQERRFKDDIPSKDMTDLPISTNEINASKLESIPKDFNSNVYSEITTKAMVCEQVREESVVQTYAEPCINKESNITNTGVILEVENNRKSPDGRFDSTTSKDKEALILHPAGDTKKVVETETNKIHKDSSWMNKVDVSSALVHTGEDQVDVGVVSVQVQSDNTYEEREASGCIHDTVIHSELECVPEQVKQKPSTSVQSLEKQPDVKVLKSEANENNVRNEIVGLIDDTYPVITGDHERKTLDNSTSVPKVVITDTSTYTDTAMENHLILGETENTPNCDRLVDSNTVVPVNVNDGKNIIPATLSDNSTSVVSNVGVAVQASPQLEHRRITVDSNVSPNRALAQDIPSIYSIVKATVNSEAHPPANAVDDSSTTSVNVCTNVVNSSTASPANVCTVVLDSSTISPADICTGVDSKTIYPGDVCTSSFVESSTISPADICTCVVDSSIISPSDICTNVVDSSTISTATVCTNNVVNFSTISSDTCTAAHIDSRTNKTLDSAPHSTELIASTTNTQVHSNTDSPADSNVNKTDSDSQANEISEDSNTKELVDSDSRAQVDFCMKSAVDSDPNTQVHSSIKSIDSDSSAPVDSFTKSTVDSDHSAQVDRCINATVDSDSSAQVVSSIQTPVDSVSPQLLISSPSPCSALAPSDQSHSLSLPADTVTLPVVTISPGESVEQENTAQDSNLAPHVKVTSETGSDETGSHGGDSGHISGTSAENTPEHKPRSQQHLSIPSLVCTSADEKDEDEEDIDDLVSSIHSRNTLSLRSHLTDSRESLYSIYSDAGEINYGKIPVTGEILFGLDYNYKTGALEIYVKQCKDLAPVDTKRNRSDPYVKTYLLPDKTRSGKRKTKIKKHTLSPTFDEVIRYVISKSEVENRVLWVTVWHNDRFGRNDFLGEVMISMECFKFGDSSPKWYLLQERLELPENSLSYKGDLVLSLKFVTADHIESATKKGKSKKCKDTNRGELHAFIKESRNLTAVRANGTSDPFCKGYLLPEKNKNAKQKTPVVKRNCSPAWNHIFLFEDVNLEELKNRSLELTIWDHDRLTSNDFLGGVRLNLGTGVFNGVTTEWMDARGEEIYIWQSMLERPNTWVNATVGLRHTMGKSEIKK